MIAEEHIYDIIIIGAGPAGCSAAMYASRARLDTVIIEKAAPGGQMAQSKKIDNYPGIGEIDGLTLGERMHEAALGAGAKAMSTEVTGAKLKGEIKTLETAEGTFKARCVIIATGADYRELGIDGEKELVGRGVSYCAACDGAFFSGRTVAVVGGGNSAAHEALLLSRTADKVLLIHRRDTFKMEKSLEDALKSAENIEFILSCDVIKFLHGDTLTGVVVKNTATNEEKRIECDGLFVSIGRKPKSELFANELKTDEGGYIIADETTRTQLPGVFAAGDIRTKRVRQIVTAAADGAVSALMAEKYLTQDI